MWGFAVAIGSWAHCVSKLCGYKMHAMVSLWGTKLYRSQRNGAASQSGRDVVGNQTYIQKRTISIQKTNCLSVEGNGINLILKWFVCWSMCMYSYQLYAGH